MTWPSVTFCVPNLSVPTVGNVVIMTALKVLPSMSLKPKSFEVKDLLPFWAMLMVALVPMGASFTEVMLVVNETVVVLNWVKALLLVSVVIPLARLPMPGGELSTSLTTNAGGVPL